MKYAFLLMPGLLQFQPAGFSNFNLIQHTNPLIKGAFTLVQGQLTLDQCTFSLHQGNSICFDVTLVQGKLEAL